MIRKSIVELYNLQSNKLYSISKIEWWLLKYEQLFNECNSKSDSHSCFNDLPCSCSFNSEESKFISLYNNLDELTLIHRYEEICKKELNDYSTIKNNPTKVSKWISQNESLGRDILSTFMLDYLDYDDITHHLKIYCPEFSDIEIFVNRNEFTQLIEFKELFDSLYYNGKLIPFNA